MGETVKYGPGGGSGAATAARIKEAAVEAAAQVNERVSEFGQIAADEIDAKREPVANALNQAASTLHRQGDSVAGVAHTAADKLDSTANYVRKHAAKSMIGDVQDMAKRYPRAVLAAAVTVGFVLGRLSRRT